MAVGIQVYAKAIQRPTSYYYQRGVEAYTEENDSQKAIEYLNKELDDNPKNGYAYSWLAYIRLQQEEYGRALHCATSAIKLIPKADKEYLQFTYSTRASVHENLKDSTAALADWTLAIKADQSSYKPYQSRAEIYFERQQYALADADYRKMIETNDNYGIIFGYMGLGRNQRNLKNYEEAIRLFTKVISLSGDEYSLAYSFRAESLLELKRYEEAVSDLVKALGIDNDDKAFWLMSKLRDEEPVEMMLQKLKLQCVFAPNEVEWPYYMGIVYEKNNHYKLAIDAYKKANKLNHLAAIDNNISRCYVSLGDFPSALQYINYAIDADSTDCDYYYLRADIYAELDQIDKSIEDMTSYIELTPKYHFGYYRRGWWKHIAGLCEEAIEDFNLTKAIDSSYPYTYDGMARCYMALGDTAKAIAEYEKMLSIDTVADGNSCAAYAYYFIGQEDKALEWLQKSLDKDSTEYYYAACIYSLVGDTAKALSYLRKSLEDGFLRFHHLDIDTDLENIRHLDSYKQLIEEYKIKAAENMEVKEEIVSSEQRIVEVPFSKANGVTKVDCSVNGLPLNFVFDTGASDVSLSQVEATFMFKNGYLNEKDIVGKQHYRTADGNISEGTVINLRQINFGGLELNDVRASVSKSQNAPLLLGQSILQRLGKIEIDNEKRVLKITTFGL